MNIQYYNKCVQYALEQKGLTGKTFSDTNLRVYNRFDFDPQAIYSAVGKGGIIMPIISGKFFTSDTDNLVYSVILLVNRASEKIVLYNPISSIKEEYPLEQFIQQWVTDGGDCITAFPVDEKTYQPTITDLSQIQLPEDLMTLCEQMAENAHDVWAIERQSEGWTYGPKRDDHKLQTPDMLPYAQLPETEKQYDRLMATGTLKLLLSLGYKIEKK